MSPRFSSLLVVLALAFAWGAPAVSAAESTPASLGSEGVIYPRNSPEARQQRAADEPFPIWGALGVAAVLGGAGFYLLRRGQLGRRPGSEVHQRLVLEETRPLGNKQFLAVAAYGEKRLLLSVCPGRIDFLCRLDEAGAATAAATSSADAPRREPATGQA
ncbi:MAG TPA: flagellar biosynthetic protein FliO [Opitutaceae bacterium]|nr:flagellar biosynthetic protein FliO [Opitutaceae bacterium]